MAVSTVQGKNNNNRDTMKKSLFAATLFSCGILNAATPIDGLYSSVFGGYEYIPSNLNIVRSGLFFNSASYNGGWHAGLRFGYQSNPMRYELEYTYLRAKLDRFNINFSRQLGVDGYFSASLLMANVYYDFPDMLPQISPFLGVGIGYAIMEARYRSVGPFVPISYRPDNNEFAYQGTAGLTYNFAENYSANIAYRYVATNRADNFGRSFDAHLGSVGVIYRFDEARYK